MLRSKLWGKNSQEIDMRDPDGDNEIKSAIANKMVEKISYLKLNNYSKDMKEEYTTHVKKY